MSRSRVRPLVRRLLPWLGLWLGLQLALGIAGRLAAGRVDEGDETSAVIRRLITFNGTELRPVNPELSQVRMDLAMAGSLLDLSGLAPVPGGIDVTARVLMSGLGVRVPASWKVWSSFGGVGGLGLDGAVERVDDPAEADLRLRGRALFGGIGVETPDV